MRAVLLSGKQDPVAENAFWVLGIAACVLIYLKNYWLAEDSYINFRSLDQLWAGRGPVWNAGERVQVYTSALWYWLVAAVKAVIRDNYLATFFTSLVLYLFVLQQAVRMQACMLAALLAIALLLSSNSFMDFAASGLENVLIYWLLLLFYVAVVKREQAGNIRPYLLAALLLVARHDLALLILPASLWLFFSDSKRIGWSQALRSAALGGLPFIGWELFAILYYGFPFPNTAYAKLSSGVPAPELLQQGFNYVLMSSEYDMLLPAVIVVGVLSGLTCKVRRWFAIGVLLNVAYVIYIGGDYMRGRFFSYAYLLSAIMLVQALSGLLLPLGRTLTIVLLLLLAGYHAVRPFTPITTGLDFSDHEKRLETANERGIFYASTSLVPYFAASMKREPFPAWPFYLDGLRLKQEHREPWIVLTNIGMAGYAMGLDVHIFDRLALSDPLLARLPAPPGSWTPGHFAREMPWGYVEANLYTSRPVYDPDLDAYYRQLRLITRSADLFSAERIKAIILFNFSHPSHLLRAHIEGWKLRTCTTCSK